MTTFSLVATVLNEGNSVHHLMESLLSQTHPPDEIVLVDGGSTDDTITIIERYQARLPLKLLRAPGCNISQGRNAAINAASGEVIVVTDAGVRIPPDWFEKITAPFRESLKAGNVHEGPMIVAGFFHPDPDPQNAFEVAMSAAVLPLEEDVQPRTFLPSSRSVAFRKSAWEKVGGYPEWLDYCEDLIFDLRLKANFGDFVFAPDAYVYFKPRSTWGGYFRQYFRYARGDGKADLWRKRHAARYFTYLVLIPGLALLSILVHPAFALLYVLGGYVYLRQPYRRLPHLWRELPLPGKLLAWMYIPLIRVVGDIAKIIGYPVGWVWRWKNHPPDWKS